MEKLTKKEQFIIVGGCQAEIRGRNAQYPGPAEDLHYGCGPPVHEESGRESVASG